MPIFNVFPKGNRSALLGMVNERNVSHAHEEAIRLYGRVRQHLGPMIDRPLMVEPGETQTVVVKLSALCPHCGTMGVQ